MAKQSLYIIDGNAILHRAWHALPPLATKDGMLVNAVYGFLLILLKLMRDEKPTHLAVAFDLAGPTFRHETYEDYKANRVKAPDELYDQLPILREILEAMKIPVYEKPGFEADDVIGTIATTAAKQIEVYIVTGDMDTLQLIGKNIFVYTFNRGIKEGQIYDAAAVRARFGLEPEQMIDYKALRGDPSDNIKGVKGIGEKTATELLQQFGTLENIFKAIKKSDPKTKKIRPRVLELLEEGEADAEMAKDLVTIRRTVSLEFSLKDALVEEPDREKLTIRFQELGFRSLIYKLPGAAEAEAPKPRTRASAKEVVSYTLLKNRAEVENWLKKNIAAVVAIRLLPTPAHVFDRACQGIVVATAPGQAVCVPCEYSALLEKLFSDASITKVGHDLKRDMHGYANLGLAVQPPFEDVMVASYLINPGSRSHSLRDLMFEKFGRTLKEISDQGTLLPPRLEDLYAQACEEADYILRLRPLLIDTLIERSEEKLFREMEMPAVPILALMERTGIRIDTKFLDAMAKKMRKRLDELSTAMYEMAGEEFNINSPVQLKRILFEKLQISTKRVRKTAGGTLSTAASELERLRGTHPIIESIFEFRELSKLVSTYVEALPQLVSAEDKRLHTTFNQTIAATGRLSSSNPNLQNIPVRTELGREIRKAFVAEPGHQLISADYSQIELRIAAVIARVPRMMEAFRKGIDIHTMTASEIWNVPQDQVTKEQRYAAKAINFGIVYGIGSNSLAESAGISVAEAKEFIQRYFDLYPELQNYLDETKALALSLGYVETMFGRRRYLPEIASGVPQIRAEAERAAINHPVQGTATGVLIKMAMIAVHQLIEEEYANGVKRQASSVKDDESPVRMLLQVHDALILEVRNDLVGPVAKKLKDIMEHVYTLPVPLLVEVEAGSSWGDLKHIEDHEHLNSE
ncbi:MAG: DNA polymerase I [bacterium]|nr:DNA polymerase I [bacterium]